MENENNNTTTGREQRTSVLLDATVDQVWDAWTKPEHIKEWWGPDGFTNTIEKMEVQAGGEWRFTMHGPDGKDYPNKTTFHEVVRHQKLVHEHFDPNFIAIIQFESKGDQTRLDWYKLYETKELFDLVEIEYKANEGFMQTVKRLENYLAQNK